MGIIEDVMYGIQSVSQQFSRHVQVPQICPGIIGARIAPAVFINGSFIFYIAGVFDVRLAI